MAGKNWELVFNHFCLIGESPVWDPVNRRILWIDILAGEINQYFPESNEHKTFKADQMIGAIALRSSGGIISALQNGFAIIDLDKKITEFITDPESDLTGNRFNDGKCDPAGRFWAGTMDTSNIPRAGALYSLSPDLSVSVKIKGVTCSNGMAWSPDHRTFYYIDTPTRQIRSYDYNISDGNISNERIVINIPESDGYPDGMTIDESGMLWIAMWGGWKVSRWNPYTGEIIEHIPLPVSRVSSCVFGGKTMDDLYVTSARTGLSDDDLKTQPLAGSLFVVKKSGSKGMPAFEFKG